jgi:hypothetical protein
LLSQSVKLDITDWNDATFHNKYLHKETVNEQPLSQHGPITVCRFGGRGSRTTKRSRSLLENSESETTVDSGVV